MPTIKGTSLDRPVEGNVDTASCAKSIEGFIVDGVNPKFKNYNRPLLLALSVGSLVLVSVVIAANYIYLGGCGQQQAMGPGVVAAGETMLQNPDVVCYIGVYRYPPNGGTDVCCPSKIDGWKIPPCKMDSAKFADAIQNKGKITGKNPFLPYQGGSDPNIGYSCNNGGFQTSTCDPMNNDVTQVIFAT